MSKNTSVSLGDHFDQFVQRGIADGRYKNVSEVIRAGLRMLEDEEAKTIALRKAIQEGIESGFVQNYSPEEHLRELKANKHKRNG